MSVSSWVVLLGLVVMVREIRRGREIAAAHPGLHLRKGERFRTLLLQVIEPVFALVVVGSVFLSHVDAGLPSMLWAAVGAIVGAAFGVYRARSTFVRAVPALHGVVLRFSIESVLALLLLLIVKLVAEQDLLPREGVFPFLIVGLLAFLLAESVARLAVVVQRYRRESVATSPVNP